MITTRQPLFYWFYQESYMPDIYIYCSALPFSLELLYNTILVLHTGYMKNAAIALDALSIR